MHTTTTIPVAPQLRNLITGEDAHDSNELGEWDQGQVLSAGFIGSDEPPSKFRGRHLGARVTLVYVPTNR